MCFAQHHLKRLLAYSTICHAGLMLIAMGIFDSAALGAFVPYALGHGLLKGGLFAGAGIVLVRLQFMGERHLHGRGLGMIWTPALFMAGLIGFTAAPGFLLESAEPALAFCIALLTIFWKKVPLGAMFDRAERGVPFLRQWQSGHPGDYVAWLTFGAAALGRCFVLLLR